MIDIKKLDSEGQPRVVARSRNLRGLITYAGKHGVQSVVGRRIEEWKGLLYVNFKDGASLVTEFANCDVMRDFVHRKRWRWRISGGDIGGNRFHYEAAP